MGAKALALTDHGTCTGLIEFLNCCNTKGINGIPGVEAYLKTGYANRAHLVLLAKNYEGFKEICMAVSESNENIESVGGIMQPIMTKEILEKHFGNGNVIALSGCIQGVLSSVFLANEEKNRRIAKHRAKQEKLSVTNDKAIKGNEELLKTHTAELEELNAKKNELSVLAKKAFTKKEKAVLSLKKSNDPAYQEAFENLEKEKKRKQTCC